MNKKTIFFIILITIFMIIFLFCSTRTTFYIIATVIDVNDFGRTAIVTPIKQFPSKLLSGSFVINTNLNLEIGNTVKIKIKHPIIKYFINIFNPQVIPAIAPSYLPKNIKYSVELIQE